MLDSVSLGIKNLAPFTAAGSNAPPAAHDLYVTEQIVLDSDGIVSRHIPLTIDTAAVQSEGFDRHAAISDASSVMSNNSCESITTD